MRNKKLNIKQIMNQIKEALHKIYKKIRQTPTKNKKFTSTRSGEVVRTVYLLETEA